ncbi:TPA: hypothetical protein HA242_04550 [Candidatus Woesearchaeota archaeon]|nr:hypothetical protein [Candidatus Woesearchaeota archaeon]
MVVFEQVDKEKIQLLVKDGFVKEEAKTIYEAARFRKGEVAVICYTSGTALLQGNKEAVEQAAQRLQKMNFGTLVHSGKFRQENGLVIGSDESLKGDTFGGLVVAAVKADKDIREQLMELGVADSKTLSDQQMVSMAEKIKKIASCEVRSMLPEEYNKHHGTVTDRLNQLHAQCAQYLLPGKHIVDKYPGCAVGEVQEEKAESKYVEVAAASILARVGALQQMDYLSMLAGFTLPKGSTHVKEALLELKKRELEFIRFVKVDFKNVKEFLG